MLVIIAAWSYSTWPFERQRRIEAVIEAVDRCRALIHIIDAPALAIERNALAKQELLARAILATRGG